MKKILIKIVLLLSVSTLYADDTGTYNAGLKVGTLGVGFDISTPINSKYSLRFNLNAASHSQSDKENGNDYDGTLDLLNMGLILDYHPFENNFRLSAGVYYNGNKFTGSAKPTDTETINIDGVHYSQDDISSLNAEVTFNTFSPYLGIGWGHGSYSKGWSLALDLGLMYHGSGKVDLNADIIDQSLIEKLEENLANEENEINDLFSNTEFYPVVSVGINYTF